MSVRNSLQKIAGDHGCMSSNFYNQSVVAPKRSVDIYFISMHDVLVSSSYVCSWLKVVLKCFSFRLLSVGCCTVVSLFSISSCRLSVIQHHVESNCQPIKRTSKNHRLDSFLEWQFEKPNNNRAGIFLECDSASKNRRPHRANHYKKNRNHIEHNVCLVLNSVQTKLTEFQKIELIGLGILSNE